MIHSKYLAEALDPEKRRLIINQLVTTIRKSGIEFDSIAFIGISGALIAPTVADRLHKTLLVIRKAENSHTTDKVEGSLLGTAYIIIDDQVATGNTLNKIINTIRHAKLYNELEPKAVFLYADLENVAISRYEAFNLGKQFNVAIYDKKVKMYDPQNMQ